MVRFIFCTALMVVSSRALAWVYQTDAHFESPPATLNVMLTQSFIEKSWRPLDQSAIGRISVLNMDQIFVSSARTFKNAALFVKWGLKPSDPKLQNKLLSHPKGHMFHGVYKGAQIAVFFYQMTSSQAQAVVRDLFQIKRSSVFEVLFVNRAYAQSPVCENPSATETIQALQPQVQESMLSEVVQSCAVSALRGVVDGAKDLVESTWGFFKTLVTDPKELWNQTVQQFEQLQDFVLNFRTRMSDFFDGLSEMEPQVLAEVACSTVSSVVTQAMIGGGIAKAGLVLTQKIATLSSLRTTLMALSRIGRMPSAGPESAQRLTRGVIQCAL